MHKGGSIYVLFKRELRSFCEAKEPAGVDNKSAYLIGSGLASLAAAVFMVRDAQVPGKNIHVLEELSLPGGSMDGIYDTNVGEIVRVAGKWNRILRLCGSVCSIPSLEIQIPVLD